MRDGDGKCVAGINGYGDPVKAAHLSSPLTQSICCVVDMWLVVNESDGRQRPDGSRSPWASFMMGAYMDKG